MRQQRYFFLLLVTVIIFLLSLPSLYAASWQFSSLKVNETPTPTKKGSICVSFFSSNNKKDLLMSWLEPLSDSGYSLKYSKNQRGNWGEAVTIHSGKRVEASYVEVPSVIALESGEMAAIWTEMAAQGEGGSDIKIAFLNDSGNGWDSPFSLPSVNKRKSNGMVTLLPWKNGTVFVTWIEADPFAIIRDEKNQIMRETGTLYSGVLDRSGHLLEKKTIYKNVCSCCQPEAAKVGEDVVIGFRGRSDLGFRDVWTSKYHAGTWSKPNMVYPDGWKINGCPVNGPSLAVGRKVLAVAWFTAVNGPEVRVAFSIDKGASFGKMIRVNTGRSVGRVDVVMLDDESIIVSWLDTGQSGRVVKARQVKQDGTASPVKVLISANKYPGRGFPKIVLLEKGLHLAWTAARESLRVRTGAGSFF